MLIFLPDRLFSIGERLVTLPFLRVANFSLLGEFLFDTPISSSLTFRHDQALFKFGRLAGFSEIIEIKVWLISLLLGLSEVVAMISRRWKILPAL